MQLFGLISRKVTVLFPAIRAIKQAFIYVSSRKKEKQYQSMCTLLPSMQFGTLHHVEPDGKQVFITANKKLVCPHGECSSTILFWLREERLARTGERYVTASAWWLSWNLKVRLPEHGWAERQA